VEAGHLPQDAAKRALARSFACPTPRSMPSRIRWRYR